MENDSQCVSPYPFEYAALEQFQEKCETVFRPQLHKNKELERFRIFDGKPLGTFFGTMLY
ncbi:hypothetical protein NAC44_10040 [Allorhizobium sp. BGMRC 0089]|uniref:hypothetical protein n=1 Tax=Allorhizobium sonneratiae TaxID=2934936 RepID=UPI002034976A|nr:hypothetical protein [Allorhizobium sonneratiae]MCM2292660.1 hypothetical protein [Allorhizobium sonneratiae]